MIKKIWAGTGYKHTDGRARAHTYIHTPPQDDRTFLFHIPKGFCRVQREILIKFRDGTTT